MRILTAVLFTVMGVTAWAAAPLPIQHSPLTTTTNDPAVTVAVTQPISVTTTNIVGVEVNGLIKTTNLANAFMNVRSFGAMGDGITDDTVAWQKAINAIEAHGGILLAPPGKYPISSTLIITNGNGVRITGANFGAYGGIPQYPGALLVNAFPAGSTNPVMDVINGNMLRIDGLGWYGFTNPAPCLRIRTDVAGHMETLGLFEHLFFYKCYQAIDLNPNGLTKESDFNRFINCRMEEGIKNFATIDSDNSTCITFDNCVVALSRSATNDVDAVCFWIKRGNIINIYNVGAAFGNEFVRVDYQAGTMDICRNNYEQAWGPSPMFLRTTSPGANTAPLVLKGNWIQYPVHIEGNSRQFQFEGNRLYDAIYTVGDDNLVRDLGNDHTRLSGTVTNGTFASNLNGWTSVGWSWANPGASNDALNTNAISQPFPTRTNWYYIVFYTITNATVGFVEPHFGPSNGADAGGNGIHYDVFKSTNGGTVTLSFQPMTNNLGQLFDGTIRDVFYQYYSPNIIDSGAATVYRSIDELNVPDGYVAMGDANNELGTDPYLQYNRTNTWLHVGNDAVTGQISVGTTLRPAATAKLWAEGVDVQSGISDPYSSNHFSMFSGGSYQGLFWSTNSYVLFGEQPWTNRGSVTGLTFHTRLDANGRSVWGWAGEVPSDYSDVRMLVNGGLRTDTLKASTTANLQTVISTNGFTLQTGYLDIQTPGNDTPGPTHILFDGVAFKSINLRQDASGHFWVDTYNSSWGPRVKVANGGGMTLFNDGTALTLCPNTTNGASFITSISSDVGSARWSLGIGAADTNVVMSVNYGNFIVQASGGSNLLAGTTYVDALYATNDVSALTFTDRSRAPTNLTEALAIVRSLESTNGRVNHTKLHRSAWGTRIERGAVVPDQTKRDLGMVVSAQGMVIADLDLRVDKLEMEVKGLLALVATGGLTVGGMALKRKYDSSNA